MGGAVSTYVNIINSSNDGFDISIDAVENYDWEGHNRPDHNLRGRHVESGHSIRERLDLNSNANGNMYNMRFNFPNGSHIFLRIDQRLADPGKHPSHQILGSAAADLTQSKTFETFINIAPKIYGNDTPGAGAISVEGNAFRDKKVFLRVENKTIYIDIQNN